MPVLRDDRTAFDVGPTAASPHLGGVVVSRQDDVELRVKGTTEVRVYDLTYPPGSFSGWHTHPGIVVVVKEGAVDRQSGGESEEFTVGARSWATPGAISPGRAW